MVFKRMFNLPTAKASAAAILFGWLLLFATQALAQVDAQPSGDDAPAPRWPLAILLEDVGGHVSREQAKQLTQVMEDILFSYTNLAVYTRAEFLNQLGWERQNQTLNCQFPDDCAIMLKQKLGIQHELSLMLMERADGQLNMRLRLVSGQQNRNFVEVLPEFAAAPALITRVLPDLIGIPPDLAAGDGVVHVTSFPMGAQVRVNGKPVGTTPISIAAEAGKTLELAAERADHPAFIGRIVIEKAKVLRWHADLVTRQGELLVDSNPAGASVFVDGEQAGTTPLVMRHILSGKHTVVLRMPPYPDATYDVTVFGGELARVRHGFASDHGTLIVNPQNAPKRTQVEIYLDDAKVAEQTYTANLPPGRYSVAIVAEGFKTHHQVVELQSGQAATVAPVLEKGLSLKPGQVVQLSPDYRPGGFTTGLGAVMLGVGIYLEIAAQSYYDSAATQSDADAKAADESDGRTHRITGGVLMGVGSAALIAGTVLLILPPEREIAVTPAISPDGTSVSLMLHGTF